MLEVKESKVRNPKGTFSFKNEDGVPTPTLLMREIFRDIENNEPEVFVKPEAVDANEAADRIVSRVSKKLYDPSILNSDNSKGTIKTYLQHLSNLNLYENGMRGRNNTVRNMYLLYRKNQ